MLSLNRKNCKYAENGLILPKKLNIISKDNMLRRISCSRNTEDDL